jgi:hypothetical protein
VVFSGAGLLLTAAGRADSISSVDLNPVGAQSSGAMGVSGGQQAGFAYFGGSQHAALWTGSAASFVDLNPAGADWSTAYGVSGGIQVGVASFGGVQHAGMWTGTAASFVDLNPVGATRSAALGVGGGQQVGYADGCAALWTGSAASFVNLNPPLVEVDPGVWLYGSSYALATDGTHQAGWAGGYGSRGGLWSGTALSYSWYGEFPVTGVSGDSLAQNVGTVEGTWAVLGSVSVGGYEYLPPDISGSADGSYARGVSGQWVVGTEYIWGSGNVASGHAALWSGTPYSYTDLGGGDAYGLSVDGNSIHIAGGAGDHATLWTVVVPEPEHYALVGGLGLMGSALFLRRRSARNR